MRRSLCIALHDVAPATWPECEQLLAMLAALGRPPITLLVVPEYHGGQRIDQAPAVVDAIDAWRAQGAEVVLHGYRHLDDAPRPRMPVAWLQRRVLTAGEGEFAALPAAEAQYRIERGRALLARLGWDVCGFVPPAWLAGAGTWQALRGSALCYTSSHHALVRLADGARIGAPCLTASTRSAWRRLTSHGWLAAMEAATMNTPLLRVGLHPADARHSAVMAHWQRLLAKLLAERETLTKSRAMDRFECAAQPQY